MSAPNLRAYDREAEQLERDLDEGVITLDEFRREIRELNAALHEEAAEEAERYYRDMTGDW